MAFSFFNLFKKKKQADKKEVSSKDKEKTFREFTEKYQVDKKVKAIEGMFTDISGRMVPNREDGTSGSATHYNYLKIAEGIPADKAVDSYLEIRNILRQKELTDVSRLVIYDYGSFLNEHYGTGKMILFMWMFSSTFMFVDEADLPDNEEELERLYQKCRDNHIHLAKGDYSLSDNKHFHISDEEYPGSADDAATYIEYTLHWTD